MPAEHDRISVFRVSTYSDDVTLNDILPIPTWQARDWPSVPSIACTVVTVWLTEDSHAVKIMRSMIFPGDGNDTKGRCRLEGPGLADEKCGEMLGNNGEPGDEKGCGSKSDSTNCEYTRTAKSQGCENLGVSCNFVIVSPHHGHKSNRVSF